MLSEWDGACPHSRQPVEVELAVLIFHSFGE